MTKIALTKDGPTVAARNNGSPLQLTRRRLGRYVGEMAKRPSAHDDTPEPREFRSTDEIDKGIAKLSRRIADIEKLRDDRVAYNDARVRNVVSDVRDTIADVFGPRSREAREHAQFGIPRSVGVVAINQSPSYYQREFDQALPGAVVRVQGLIARLKEKREDLATPAVSARAALESRDLNSTIATDSVTALFRDGHYAQSVFEASKLLVNFVKGVSGIDVDGAPLMMDTFSPNDPRLAFNDLADDSDRSEQRGFMYLYAGAVLAIRNPRAHRAEHVDTPERALQYLDFLSLLADLITSDAKKLK